MTSTMFVTLVQAIITICGILITAYLVPYIKGAFAQDQLDKFFNYVAIAVRCAEQIYTVEQWKEKKEYVLSYAKKVLSEKIKINLTDDDIDVIIEGIVNEIKHGE